MPNFFSQLWTGSEYRWHQENAEGQPLRHAASNHFSARGVRPGDVLYIWSFTSGQLLLMGRMEIGEIATRERAVHVLKNPNIADLDEHALARSCSAKTFGIQVSLEVMRQLRFVSANGEIMEPKFRTEDAVDPQTFRGVRQLTAASASLLDQLMQPSTVRNTRA